jgi:hypothetical protein
MVYYRVHNSPQLDSTWSSRIIIIIIIIIIISIVIIIIKCYVLKSQSLKHFLLSLVLQTSPI